MAQLAQEIPGLHYVVPVAPGIDKERLAPLWQQGAMALDRNLEGYALRADAAIAVSGTATLELALWGTPTLLVYRASPLMVTLARALANIRCAGLANLILGDQPVMPELIQEACTPENIIRETLQLLKPEIAADQRRHCAELRKRLGTSEPASGVAAMVESLIDDRV